MDLNEHIRRKELINMRESSLSDWREDIMEEGDHPYVDVMPSADPEEGMKKEVKKKKEKKEEEKEEVKESIVDDEEHRKNFKDAADNVAKGMAARRKKLDLGKKK